MKIKIVSIMLLLLLGICTVSYADCGTCCGGDKSSDTATAETAQETTEDTGITETAETE